MKDTTILEQKEFEVLASGAWGTIKPHSVSAAAALAGFVGAKYGLLCHSMDAAYEALLRYFGSVASDDCIAAAEVSDPTDSLIALCVGATPVFIPNCPLTAMADPKAIGEVLTSGRTVRCVVLDLIADAFDRYPLDEVFRLCRSAGVPLLLNAGGFFTLKWRGQPLCAHADAVVYSLEEGSEIYTGKGGFLASDDPDVYAGAFAYHNCGRSFGEGCTLQVDDIIGGDLRVSEWTAAAAEVILETGQLEKAVPRKQVRMAGQPVFESDYAKKQTKRPVCHP